MAVRRRDTYLRVGRSAGQAGAAVDPSGVSIMSVRHLTAAALAAVLAAAAPAAALLSASSARAQAPRDATAEAFVAREGQMALAILNSPSLSATQKKVQFRQFVDRAADVPRITNFVLGRYRRQLSPGQYAQFAAAFREYANTVYESRLGQYTGEGFRVTGSQAKTPADVVVASQVVGGTANRRADVNWRLIKGPDGRWRVVDVNIAGVWLAITQQQDFVSTLDNNRGDINVLVGQLRGR